MWKLSIGGIVGMLCFVSAALAHDSWVLGRPVVVEAGEPVEVVFSTGETFPISEHGTDPSRVDRWVMVRDGSKQKVTDFAVKGDELLALVRPDSKGLWIAAAALKPQFIEIEGEGFNKYLQEEAATAALHMRRESGASSLPGREYYTKAGKAYLCAGDTRSDCEGKGAGFDRPVGHVLEIVPLSNPFSWRAGDEVAVRVLRDGKPAQGLRVSSGHEGLPEHAYIEHVVTDENGEARFKLSRDGLWFLRTHVIEPLQPPARRGGEDAPVADWESFWASMTFEVQPR